MKAKTLLLSMLFTFAVSSSVWAQGIAPDGYDRTGIDEPGTIAGTTLVQDLDEIKKRAIENIINRIRRGDPNVLKFVVYDVFTEVHKEILRESRERTAKQPKDAPPVSYYDVVGGKAALPSFFGCFDNQDPKVRLRCIGYLGDWIDDIGMELLSVVKAAKNRLEDNIETRVEVRYGLMLLWLKVMRKQYLNNIWNGDEEVLKVIAPDHFVVLVHNEPFIRQMFCIPADVRLRSIRLLQWWLDYFPEEGVYWYRTLGDEQTERTLTNQFTPYRNIAKELELRLKVHDPSLLYRNYGGHPQASVLSADKRSRLGYGYQDPCKNLDIASLYDLRYFRYSSQEQLMKDPFQNEEKYIPAIFAGLENPSLFVRENVARLLVRLTDGPLGFTERDNANYNNIRIGGGGGASGGFVPWSDDPSTSKASSRNNTPYELLDDTNEVIGVQGILSRLAKNARYQSVLKEAWRGVRFAQFADVHENYRVTNAGGAMARFKNEYDQNEGVRLERNVPFSQDNNSWGYKYTYRTDIADLMRRFNLGKELAYCEQRRVQPTVSTGGLFFVEDLFDLDEQGKFAFPGSNVQVPLWHGKDEIKDEVFDP